MMLICELVFIGESVLLILVVMFCELVFIGESVLPVLYPIHFCVFRKKILGEVQSSERNKLPSNKSVLVLGK